MHIRSASWWRWRSAALTAQVMEKNEVSAQIYLRARAETQAETRRLQEARSELGQMTRQTQARLPLVLHYRRAGEWAKGGWPTGAAGGCAVSEASALSTVSPSMQAQLQERMGVQAKALAAARQEVDELSSFRVAMLPRL